MFSLKKKIPHFPHPYEQSEGFDFFVVVIVSLNIGFEALKMVLCLGVRAFESDAS